MQDYMAEMDSSPQVYINKGALPFIDVWFCISCLSKLFRKNHFIPQSGLIIFVPAFKEHKTIQIL